MNFESLVLFVIPAFPNLALILIQRRTSSYKILDRLTSLQSILLFITWFTYHYRHREELIFLLPSIQYSVHREKIPAPGYALSCARAQVLCAWSAWNAGRQGDIRKSATIRCEALQKQL